MTQLATFLAVVRGGSVTAAADELVVTQPSVSSAIAALGRELGCDVLERSGRGVRLTEAGAAFAPYASEVLGLLEHGRQAAREAAGLVARRLRIGAVTTAAECFVPPLMHAFSQQHEGIELMLDVGNRQVVLDRVLDHSIDVAITGQPPANARLLAERLMDNKIVCITAAEDPSIADGPWEAEELQRYTWLLREPGSGTRALNERYLAEHGLQPRTLTLGSNGAIKQAARAGVGISLLSRCTIESELASGQVAELQLRDPPPARHWFVLRSAVGPVRPIADAFIAFARGAGG